VFLLKAFAMVMETTAFNGDLALHFPDIYHQLYDTNNEFQETIKWAVNLVNESKLYDETSQRMIELVSQELNIIPRQENYFNPFAKKNKRKSQVVQEQPKPKEIKKKKRGPGLSGTKTDL
jgi:3'-phosphoadenosine 5'-phosphosulfate sulfotransferase (PAPS reductase)/FAD synthetase